MKKNADQVQRRVDQVPRQDRPQGRGQPEHRDDQEQDLDHGCGSTKLICLRASDRVA